MNWIRVDALPLIPLLRRRYFWKYECILLWFKKHSLNLIQIILMSNVKIGNSNIPKNTTTSKTSGAVAIFRTSSVRTFFVGKANSMKISWRLGLTWAAKENIWLNLYSIITTKYRYRLSDMFVYYNIYLFVNLTTLNNENIPKI